MPTAVVMHVWCAAPAWSQEVTDVWKSGSGRHTARPTGSRGRLGGGDVLDDVGDEPEAVAHVGQRDDDAPARDPR